MSDISSTLASLTALDGTLAAAVVDGNSGKVLGKTGNAEGLDLAANINTSVMRSKLHGVRHLGIQEDLEDIIITSTQHYHLVTFIRSKPGFFIYLGMDKQTGNLGAARYAANVGQENISW
jgi:hypothetical protein